MVSSGTLLKQRYCVRQKLGAALYGAVWLCEDTLSDNALVAVKQVSMQKARRALTLDRRMDNPWDERRITAKLTRLGSHDNILGFYDEFLEYGSWFVVMEYCNGGDMLELLHQSPDVHFPETYAMNLFASITEGVQFLHANGIAHRDLSLENVLLHNNVPKLCDFGLSTESDRMCSECVGKAYYMAPEIIALEEDYDPAAADMWSLGVMLFIMLTGSPLVPSASAHERAFQALQAFGVQKIIDVWELNLEISPRVVDLLEGLLQVNPAKRLTIDDVLAHLAMGRQT